MMTLVTMTFLVSENRVLAASLNFSEAGQVLAKVAQYQNSPQAINIDVEIGQSLAEIKKQKAIEEAAKQNQKKVVSRSKSVIFSNTSGNTEIDQLIDQYSNVNGIPEKSNLVKRIVYCESKGDPNVKNRYSTAGGLAQYLDRTWAATPEGQLGLSKYDPNAALSAMTRDIAQGLQSKWNASRGCW